MLRRRLHSAAGGRAAAAGAPAPGVGVAGSSSPHPSLFARGSRSRRGSRKQRPASTRAGRTLYGVPSPARGSPRGGVSPSGTRFAPWYCPDTRRLHGRAGAWAAGGEAEARPGQGAMRLQLPLQRLGLPRSVGCGSPGQGPHCGAEGVGCAQRDAFKLAGDGRGGYTPRRSCLVRAERDSGPWFSPNLGPSVRTGLGQPRSGAVSSEKVEEGTLISSLSPRYNRP